MDGVGAVPPDEFVVPPDEFVVPPDEFVVPPDLLLVKKTNTVTATTINKNIIITQRQNVLFVVIVVEFIYRYYLDIYIS